MCQKMYYELITIPMFGGEKKGEEENEKMNPFQKTIEPSYVNPSMAIIPTTALPVCWIRFSIERTKRKHDGQ